MPEWLSFAVAKDSLLALLAVYGAVLSTFNWRQAARRDRRTLRASLSTVIRTYDDGGMSPTFAKLEATNLGHRPVTITYLALQLPNRKLMVPVYGDQFPGVSDTKLPATLTDGQSAHLIFPYAGIAEGLYEAGYKRQTKVVPICKDSADNNYRGKPWKVNPAEFAGM